MMDRIRKKFNKFWKEVFSESWKREYLEDIFFDDAEPIFFDKIIHLTKTPSNDQIKPKEFVVVEAGKKRYWALFQCPCGCGHVISLSLQKVHRPRWTVKASKGKRPTLAPSVWQNTGCKSHFWISDGRVFWCQSSGEDLWHYTDKENR